LFCSRQPARLAYILDECFAANRRVQFPSKASIACPVRSTRPTDSESVICSLSSLSQAQPCALASAPGTNEAVGDDADKGDGKPGHETTPGFRLGKRDEHLLT
jgi:hypothetical protein